MQNRFKNIRFDRTNTTQFDFEILPLKDLFAKTNLDHNPQRPHRVEFFVMLLIIAGNGKHTIDFKEYDYSKGSVITVRKNQIHHFHNSNATGYLLLFTEEYVLSYQEQASAKKIPELFNELLFYQHTQLNEIELNQIIVLINQILEEYEQPIDNHTSSIVRNLLQILVSKIHRVRSSSIEKTINQKYISQFMKFQALVEVSCQKHRKVQYYANQLCITSKTLNNITQEVVNESAKKCIDAICIIQIKRLLINTNLTVKEIAYSFGFDEPTNFFKYFKRFTQQTPEAFRAYYLQ